MNSLVRRTSPLAVIAVTALVLGSAGAALASTPATPTGTAATWLNSQLTDGLIDSGYYADPSDPSSWTTYVDQGQSADVAFGLAALGDSGGAKVVADALSSQIGAWYDSYGTIYAGSLAKAIVLGQSTGEDLSSWGGGALVSTLEAHTATTAPIAGRIENAGETSYPSGDPTDSANVIGQAYAARALTNAHSPLAHDSTAFLLEQQCSGGGFRLDLTTDKTNADQSCGASDAADVDATAYAVLQLERLPASGAVATAIGKARTWLASVQLTDGSWREEPTDPNAAPNADSTGLAAQALGAGTASAKAAQWIEVRQAKAGASNSLASSAGAIAGTDAYWQQGLTNGITKDVAYYWRKATADAAPALAYLPAATVTPVSQPVPAKPTIIAPKKAHAGSTVKFTVRGLKPGEKVTVTLRGKKVGHGKARANGTFKVKVKLKGKLAKHGKAKLKVVGAKSGKVGTTIIKVVR